MRRVDLLAVLLGVLLAGATVAAVAWRRAEHRRGDRLFVAALAEEAFHPATALGDLRTALELDPRLGRAALPEIAKMLQATGENREAFLVATEALDLDPGNPETYITRGLARAELRDRDGAGRDFEKAIEVEAQAWRAWHLLGNVRLAQGDAKGAIQDYTRSLSIQPVALTYRKRAEAAQRLGALQGALSDAQRAFELDPEDEVTARILAELGPAVHEPDELWAPR